MKRNFKERTYTIALIVRVIFTQFRGLHNSLNR